MMAAGDAGAILNVGTGVPTVPVNNNTWGQSGTPVPTSVWGCSFQFFSAKYSSALDAMIATVSSSVFACAK